MSQNISFKRDLGLPHVILPKIILKYSLLIADSEFLLRWPSLFKNINDTHHYSCKRKAYVRDSPKMRKKLAQAFSERQIQLIQDPHSKSRRSVPWKPFSICLCKARGSYFSEVLLDWTLSWDSPRWQLCTVPSLCLWSSHPTPPCGRAWWRHTPGTVPHLSDAEGITESRDWEHSEVMHIAASKKMQIRNKTNRTGESATHNRQQIFHLKIMPQEKWGSISDKSDS